MQVNVSGTRIEDIKGIESGLINRFKNIKYRFPCLFVIRIEIQVVDGIKTIVAETSYRHEPIEITEGFHNFYDGLSAVAGKLEATLLKRRAYRLSKKYQKRCALLPGA